MGLIYASGFAVGVLGGGVLTLQGGSWCLTELRLPKIFVIV